MSTNGTRAGGHGTAERMGPPPSPAQPGAEGNSKCICPSDRTLVSETGAKWDHAAVRLKEKNPVCSTISGVVLGALITNALDETGDSARDRCLRFVLVDPPLRILGFQEGLLYGSVRHETKVAVSDFGEGTSESSTHIGTRWRGHAMDLCPGGPVGCHLQRFARSWPRDRACRSTGQPVRLGLPPSTRPALRPALTARSRRVESHPARKYPMCIQCQPWPSPLHLWISLQWAAVATKTACAGITGTRSSRALGVRGRHSV